MRTDWPPPAEAIAQYRSAKANGAVSSWLSRGSVESELLATRDAGAYAEWLCAAPLVRDLPGMSRPPVTRGDLQGLVLRDGRGGLGLPADNPWDLPATGPLDQLIRRLWAPAAEHLAAVVDRLAGTTFALAQVRFGDRDYLAYLTAAWVSRDVPDVASASIVELMDARELTIGEVWGGRPLPGSAAAVVPALGAAMPGPLRALASVHGSLTIFDPERYIDLEYLEPYGDFRKGVVPDPGRPSTESRVAFAGHGEGWFILDRGSPDPEGDPTVLLHDPHDGLVAGWRRSLRQFLAKQLLAMLDVDG